MRVDDKWVQAEVRKREKEALRRTNFKNMRTPIIGKPYSSIKTKPKEATGEKVLFTALINTRKHVSFISGLPISNIDHNNCVHVLAKGKNKYPKFKLYDKNIVFLTREEHHLYDNGTHDQRKDYTASQFLRNNIIVDWKKLFDLRDELKKEYICDV
jgi:hypothetical protein